MSVSGDPDGRKCGKCHVIVRYGSGGSEVGVPQTNEAWSEKKKEGTRTTLEKGDQK